jgi:hypothetical protein
MTWQVGWLVVVCFKGDYGCALLREVQHVEVLFALRHFTAAFHTNYHNKKSPQR